MRAVVQSTGNRRATARHRIKDCHLMLLEETGDQIWRRPRRQQHGRRAGRHRKSQGVAEPIGEEQLRHRIANVILSDAEDRPGVKLVGEFEIGMGVHGALRLPGRARRVQPEAHVVAGRRRGDRLIVGARNQIGETTMAVRRLARDDHMLEAVLREALGRRDRGRKFRQQPPRRRPARGRGCRRA